MAVTININANSNGSVIPETILAATPAIIKVVKSAAQNAVYNEGAEAEKL